MKKVCAYARVSTGSQSQGLSLENQTAYYERLIKSNPEYEFAGVYSDRGITGTRENRRGFQSMLTDCRAGKIDLIYTKSISRFARNTVTVIKLARELKNIGVGIFFEEHNINTLSADGEVMLSVLAAFAQEESRSMSENLKWSFQKKFERGEIQINAKFFMGYDLNEYGELVVNPRQAEIVKRIFSMYINGFGSEKIARILNDEGIPTTRGGKWASSTILGIIKNEKYKGDFQLQKTFSDRPNHQIRNNGETQSWYISENHEPIVSAEIWDKAQEVMAERRKKKNIAQSDKYCKRYPLSGLLICPYCGSTLKRKQVYNKRIEWWCSKSLKEGVKACKGIHVRDDEAMAQNITEPTVVEEVLTGGKKHHSYTRKSEYDKRKTNEKKAENGGILPGFHRPRRAVIKL